MLSKTLGSTSPVGNGDAGACGGLADTKGIGGNVLPFAGDCDRADDSSGREPARFSNVPERAGSTVAVCVLEETWKNDDDALLAEVLSVVAPDGRLGSSLSFVDSRSLLLIPNERFEAFFVIVRCLSS